MDKQQRKAKIIEILKDSSGESFHGLADRLGVAEMTVRRDIRPLREKGIIKVVSGAVLLNGTGAAIDPEDYSLSAHFDLQTKEKDDIGRRAAELVKPYDVIYIDIGTTTVNLIRYLPMGIPIVAVCCSVNALIELQKREIKDIIFLGGRYIPSLQMFECREGIELLSRTRITKAFLSAAGVARRLGVTCVSGYEVETKTTAMRSALSRILMVDAQKFGVIKPAFFAKISEFDQIITDHALSREWDDALQEANITVEKAP